MTRIIYSAIVLLMNDTIVKMNDSPFCWVSPRTPSRIPGGPHNPIWRTTALGQGPAAFYCFLFLSLVDYICLAFGFGNELLFSLFVDRVQILKMKTISSFIMKESVNCSATCLNLAEVPNIAWHAMRENPSA